MANLSPAEKQAAVAAAASTDLLYLMDEAELDTDSQYVLICTNGYKTVRLVSGIEENRTCVRQCCVDVFRFDQQQPAGRLATAKMITIWKACKETLTQETKS